MPLIKNLKGGSVETPETPLDLPLISKVRAEVVIKNFV